MDKIKQVIKGDTDNDLDKEEVKTQPIEERNAKDPSQAGPLNVRGAPQNIPEGAEVKVLGTKAERDEEARRLNEGE